MNRKLKRIVVAGGSGSLGRALIDELAAEGYAASVLSRSGKPVSGAVQSLSWLGEDLAWRTELDSALAVVNLCGESIRRRWTPEAKQSIADSRIVPTLELGHAIECAVDPPRVWVNGSAAGYYGDTGQEIVDEDAPAGAGWLAGLAKDWEAAALGTKLGATKLALARTGVVLERNEGYLPTLARLTRRGFGGVAGGGRQWISWIHISDWARAVRFLIEEELDGPFNLCAPEPAQQREMSQELVRRTGSLISPPAPAFLIRLGSPLMGVEPELVLGSTRAIPERLLEAGFEFEYGSLEAALDDLLPGE